MPTDEIFDDEFMNEMMMNPDLYGLEKPMGESDGVDDEENIDEDDDDD